MQTLSSTSTSPPLVAACSVPSPLFSLSGAQKCGATVFCAKFRGGTARRDAKVGSLPHGCVHCRETSVYPPAEAAWLALERHCARLRHASPRATLCLLPPLCGKYGVRRCDFEIASSSGGKLIKKKKKSALCLVPGIICSG